jgi:hypothetical protein
MMGDFFAKVIAEMAVLIVLRIIEFVGTKAYASDVVHSLLERLQRRGAMSALRCAVRALPAAIQSRMTIITPAMVVDDYVDLAAGIFFIAAFTILWANAPSLLFFMLTLLVHFAVPSSITASMSLILTGMTLLIAISVIRQLAVGFRDWMEMNVVAFFFMTISSGSWLCIKVGYFLVVLSMASSWSVIWAAALNSIVPMILAIPVLALVVKFTNRLDEDRRPSSLLRPWATMIARGRPTSS